MSEQLRTAIRNGTFGPATPLPAKVSTVREVADAYHTLCASDPARRKHRLPILKQALDVICNTVVDGARTAGPDHQAVPAGGWKVSGSDPWRPFRVDLQPLCVLVFLQLACGQGQSLDHRFRFAGFESVAVEL